MKKKLVVGLGNPGSEYAGTRHNIGKDVVEEIAFRLQVGFKRKKELYASCARVHKDDFEIILAIPTTYMNESGKAVQHLLKEEGISPKDMAVFHDDVETKFGVLQRAYHGGTRGQNGLKSIKNHIGTMEFTQVRIGVGRPETGTTVADYVLSRFREDERERLLEIKELAFNTFEEWLSVS